MRNNENRLQTIREEPAGGGNEPLSKGKGKAVETDPSTSSHADPGGHAQANRGRSATEAEPSNHRRYTNHDEYQAGTGSDGLAEPSRTNRPRPYQVLPEEARLGGYRAPSRPGDHCRASHQSPPLEEAGDRDDREVIRRGSGLPDVLIPPRTTSRMSFASPRRHETRRHSIDSILSQHQEHEQHRGSNDLGGTSVAGPSHQGGNARGDDCGVSNQQQQQPRRSNDSGGGNGAAGSSRQSKTAPDGPSGLLEQQQRRRSHHASGVPGSSRQRGNESEGIGGPPSSQSSLPVLEQLDLSPQGLPPSRFPSPPQHRPREANNADNGGGNHDNADPAGNSPDTPLEDTRLDWDFVSYYAMSRDVP